MQSLAHELASALSPEPNASSGLLEELGIDPEEYDGGMDNADVQPEYPMANGTLAQELATEDLEIPSLGQDIPQINEPSHEDNIESYLTPSSMDRQTRQPEQDSMTILAQDLDSTDQFLTQLRRLDAEAGSSNQPPLEKVAADIIRHINDTIREREGQVRELLEYEREFRKIAGEVGGTDALSHLEALEDVVGLVDDEPTAPQSAHERLSTLEEEPPQTPTSPRGWDAEPEYSNLLDVRDDLDLQSELVNHSSKDVIPAAPHINGPPTAAAAIPQFTHVRTINTSLITSLTSISEHTQVTGAATAEAGRKIRALKNKLGGWRTDWDSAERSRLKIEKWELGVIEDSPSGDSTPSKRLDARQFAQEQIKAFEAAIAEAGIKTQAIMAAS